MKFFFFVTCTRLYRADPAHWEWQDAMLLTKKKFPKSGVHKSVFEKWVNQWGEKNRAQNWQFISGILRQTLNAQ